MTSGRTVAVAGLVAVVALCLVTWGCGGRDEESSRTAQTEVATADSAAATQIDDSGLPLLIDLGADKCVPCKMMAPILDEMTETFEGQLEVQFIDVWKDASAGREYGVRVIPTQIFLDEEGNELFRHQGFFSREDILAKWTELGYEFNG
jgi:thioredoxin 1